MKIKQRETERQRERMSDRIKMLKKKIRMMFQEWKIILSVRIKIRIVR